MEKINVAALLKGCPKGMELDCTMFENVTFVRVDMSRKQFPIEIAVSGIRSKYLTKEGCFHDTTLLPESKCVIFPKGKTTWEGFVPSCQFKDGDIVYFITENDNEYITIFKNAGNVYLETYIDVAIATSRYSLDVSFYIDNIKEQRLATEKEKQKLFDIIKANGYKWNTETKALEELIEPKFKVGNWYQCTKDFYGKGVVFDKNTAYYCAIEGCLLDGCHIAIVKDLYDNFKLWTIQDAKEGDVLAINWHKGDDSWEKIIIFKKYHNNGVEGLINSPCVEGYGNTFKNGKLAFYEEIPYFSKTWTANLHPATKEQRDLLFQTIKEAGCKWNLETKYLEKLPKFKVGDIVQYITDSTDRRKIEEIDTLCNMYHTDSSPIMFEIEDEWEIVPNKFDIATLKPFDKVLVRLDNANQWYATLFSHIDERQESFCRRYVTVSGKSYTQIIPYKGNEHLCGTKNNCDEYFKIWEH